jgi:hypothetical protein
MGATRAQQVPNAVADDDRALISTCRLISMKPT